MTEPNPQEFRRYRQALLILYIAAASLGSALVLASVAAALFFHGRPEAPLPTPAALVDCNRDVRALLEGLGKKPGELLDEAVVGDGRNLGGRWEEFASQWQTQWERVNARCRFDELADTGIGPAFDRMAFVHRKLPELKLRYRELLERFTKETAGDLAEMRAALDKSRTLLVEQAGTPPETPPGAAPAK